MMAQTTFVLFNGVASGMAFFLVAAGLTWVFGILKILNMAHGAFFMIGAYVSFSIIGANPRSLPAFLGAALVAGLIVAGLGYLTDRVVLRKLRDVDYHYVLIATFGLMLFCEGVAKAIWGLDYFSVTPPPEIDTPLQVATAFISGYTLFIIGAGLVVFVLLDVIMHRLWVGKIMRAVANDPWMAGTLGINVPTVLTLSVMASFLLAGFAGGLLLPNQTLSITVGGSFLLYSFFAVIIGGLGSIRGTFVACILLGLIESANATFLPEYGGLAIYVVLAAFLIWKPSGLFPSKGVA